MRIKKRMFAIVSEKGYLISSFKHPTTIADEICEHTNFAEKEKWELFLDELYNLEIQSQYWNYPTLILKVNELLKKYGSPQRVVSGTFEFDFPNFS